MDVIFSTSTRFVPKWDVFSSQMDQILNKTHSYHRDVFRHPSSLEMHFREKLPFYVRSISHLLIFPILKNFGIFEKKNKILVAKAFF